MDINKLVEKWLVPYKAKANEYLKDKKKSSSLLKKAVQKANTHQGTLGDTWEKLQLMFGVLKDWISGNYREIPTRSLLMIILGIVYFVSPVDGVFDYIPLLGLADDAAVAGFVISQVSIDLERYKLWKKQAESKQGSDEGEIIDLTSSTINEAST